MSSRAIQLAIDARPRGPHGPLAAERLQGRSVFCHVLDVAAELTPPGQPVVVHARPEDHARLRELAGSIHARPLTFQTGPPRADAAICVPTGSTTKRVSGAGCGGVNRLKGRCSGG